MDSIFRLSVHKNVVFLTSGVCSENTNERTTRLTVKRALKEAETPSSVLNVTFS